MPACEICGDKTETIKCKGCKTVFCDKCGDPIEMLCEYCLEEEEF